jgi:hypothetical protein
MDAAGPLHPGRSGNLSVVGHDARDEGARPDATDVDRAAAMNIEWALAHRPDFFTDLSVAVGGTAALVHLDAEPLPDEPFDWSTVDERDTAFVGAVLDASDDCLRLLFDAELRTVVYRVLGRVASGDARVLRRSNDVQRCAAALVWLAARANLDVGRRRCPNTMLWRWFHVSDCTDRAYNLRRAGGMEPEGDPGRGVLPFLGDPALLHSRYRSHLLERRDAYVKAILRERTWHVAPEGTARVRASPMHPLTAAKGWVGDRVMIVAGFGDELETATFHALGITEARHLVMLLQRALDAPMAHAVHGAD